MRIYEHLSSFVHYTVKQWNHEPLSDFANTAYRLAIDYDDPESWTDKLARFLEQPNSEQVEALIAGLWWSDDDTWETSAVVEALVVHHKRLPNLKALFIADLTAEELEISWIQQADLSPIFLAFPQLEHIGIRGAVGLQLGRLQHESLRSFTLESGGMPAVVLQQLATAHLPQLIDLELWTGSPFYGWDGTLNDLLPFIQGDAFPHLKRLAIRNCALADEVAKALRHSPLFERLEELDLSMGTLGDEGVNALLSHPALRRLNLYGQQPLPFKEEDEAVTPLALKSLDVHHHFCSEASIRALNALAKHGIDVDVGQPEQERDWASDAEGRYVAVGE